jgi:lysylphosphatidylglycerol synthetase-like protein (DUF2156 family)
MTYFWRSLGIATIVVSIFILAAQPTFAQTTRVRRVSPDPTPSPIESTATASATATNSAELSATPSAEIQQKIQAKNDQDITEPSGKSKDKLVEFLDRHPVNELAWHNPLQYAIRRAITNGLPPNIIVLILLFPVITAIISFSRHVIGLKGFGIYIPAVLSVAFVSTGVINGIFLFAVTLGAASLLRKALKPLQLQSLPRTAMLLWGVSLIMLLTLIAASFAQLSVILAASIFPILIIMLLMENFLDSQLSTSQSEAIQLTIETLLTATVCSVFIGLEMVQKFVLWQPELTLIGVAVINIIVGRYAGLRVMEWIRFRSIID